MPEQDLNRVCASAWNRKTPTDKCVAAFAPTIEAMHQFHKEFPDVSVVISRDKWLAFDDRTLTDMLRIVDLNPLDTQLRERLKRAIQNSSRLEETEAQREEKARQARLAAAKAKREATMAKLAAPK